MNLSRHDVIMLTVDDLVTDFLYQSRKEDETLPRGSIEEAILRGETSAEEIAHRFRVQLEEGLKSK